MARDETVGRTSLTADDVIRGRHHRYEVQSHIFYVRYQAKHGDPPTYEQQQAFMRSLRERRSVTFLEEVIDCPPCQREMELADSEGRDPFPVDPAVLSLLRQFIKRNGAGGPGGNRLKGSCQDRKT